MKNDPLHILHVNMSIDPVTGGGTAERTVQLARSLVQEGHHSSVLSLDLGLSEDFKTQFKSQNINAMLLPCLSKRFYIPLFSLSKVLGLIKSTDVIHLMGHWTLLNVIVFIFALVCNKPYVVCPAGALPVFGRSKWIKYAYNYLVGKRIIRRSSLCISITNDEIDQFRDYGVSESKVFTIPNGVNADDFSDRNDELFKSKHNLDQRPLILFMGRLNEIKGPDLLLEAFIQFNHMYPDYQLAFIGPDGGMLAMLEKRVAESGLESSVFFLGYLGGSEKSRAYHAADFLVIPSRQEAMSIVVLEAGVCGTPVLLTDQCGFNDVETIGGGKVVPSTVQGILNGLEVMMASVHNSDMGESLKDYVLENYTWQQMVRKYISVYRSIMDSPK